MNYKNLLSIGELVSTCNVSHKTLRYYDSIGLLKPAEVNPENGYRYYEKWQVTRIMTIKELQSLGISLVEIKMCLENGDSELLLNNLKNIFESKKNDIKEQILILNKNLEKIKIFKSQYEKIEKILMLEKEQKVTVKKLNKRRIVYKEYTGKYDSEIFRLYYKELLEYFREKGYIGFNTSSFPIAIYSKINDLNNINIKIGFQTDIGDYFGDFLVCEIPEAYYLSYIYKGNYSSLRNDAYKNIYKFIEENGYEVDGTSIEVYYISENIMIEQEYYITEIQMKVKKL
ncbi:MAG: MerR family transcriptional regulator [Clostridiaceae bacterium]